jgi:hypothetical protein
MRRQHSSDSVSSIASATSHSSVGSNMDADAKNKKKNKKNWVCAFVDMHKCILTYAHYTHTRTRTRTQTHTRELSMIVITHYQTTHTNISYSK